VRWKLKDFRSPRRNFPQPQWDGGELGGRTILLHAEQALGDTIQMARFVPIVAQHGGNIVVECQPPLRRLLRNNARGWQAIAAGEPLPQFDLHCPLLSLPLALKTTLRTIPADPYLQADEQSVQHWRQKIGDDADVSESGLGVAGSGRLHKDTRSIELSALAPLAELGGVRWYSLQKGPGEQAAADRPGGLDLLDWTDQLQDFADTAALMRIWICDFGRHRGGPPGRGDGAAGVGIAFHGHGLAVDAAAPGQPVVSDDAIVQAEQNRENGAMLCGR